MSADKQVTIRQVLNTPVQSCRDSIKRKALPSAGLDTMDVLQISHWDEFTIGNIENSAGEFLEYPCRQSQPMPSMFIETILDLKDAGKILMDSIVKPCIASAMLHQPSQVPKVMVLQDQTWGGRERPSFAFCDPEEETQALVVGYAKPVNTWKSEALPEAGSEKLRVIQQLRNCCRSAKTPFGFIFTTLEIAVFHFSHENASVEYASFYWADATQGLSPCLALWALVMMGIHHRTQA